MDNVDMLLSMAFLFNAYLTVYVFILIKRVEKIERYIGLDK